MKLSKRGGITRRRVGRRLGKASGAFAIIVGWGLIFAALATVAVYCRGWQETLLIAGFLTILAGAAELAEETRLALGLVALDSLLFGAYAIGYFFGPFTCATHLL